MIDINKLTLEEKIGQMLLVGMDTDHVPERVEDLILKNKIGGVLLYRKNYKTIDELIDLVNYIKTLNRANKVPLFIAIDQEGGRVTRLPSEIERFPSANKLAKTKDLKIVKKAAAMTGDTLNKLGFNLDFAPVLDIKRFDDLHAIGDRAFSEDYKEVSKYGIAYMKELQKNNVVSVIKHFPGHGATKTDSHFLLPTIDKTMEELEMEDTIPFEEALKNGADSLLIGHLVIKDATKKLPATMSKEFITNYVRKKCRFNGMIVSDDMRMKGVMFRYGTNKPIFKAIDAGNDLIMFKYMNNNKVIEKIVRATKKEKIKESHINASVKRILEIKEKYNINDNEIINELKLDKLNEDIKILRNKCVN